MDNSLFEIFAKNAGSAMVALVGVNDQLDFTDIAMVVELLKHSKAAYYFNTKLVEYRNELETLDMETNPDRALELEDEIRWCTGCAVTWEIEFIKEMSNISEKKPAEVVVQGAIWELEMLAKIAGEAAQHLRSNSIAYAHRNADAE